MKISLVILSAFVLNSFSAIGAEVDQFTFRNNEIQDSSELLNLKVNAALKMAVKNTNSKSQCNEEDLYKELRKYFSNHLRGKLTKDILADDKIIKRSINLENSIYQDWTVWDGVGMGTRILSRKVVTMSGEMRVGEHLIGVDKLEHMWGQGFSYFKQNYLKGEGEIKAVKAGAKREMLYLGGNKFANGVFSYGDLSANFNGMRFWNHMLLKFDDVLGPDKNLGPYIKCENDKWAQVEEIDLKNYIDDSMNESINCAKFPTKKTADKFENRLKIMGATCPLDIQRRDDMVAKYRHIAKWIINTEGVGKVKYLGEFKDK